MYRNGYEIEGANPEVGDFMGLAFDEATGEVNIAVGNGILYDEDPAGGDPIPSDGNDWFQGETDIVEGQWYHLAISNEANSIKVYLDGQLDGTGFIRARGGYMLAGGDWTIGGRGGTDNQAFVGTIDELAIYRGIKDADFFQERFFAQPPSRRSQRWDVRWQRAIRFRRHRPRNLASHEHAGRGRGGRDTLIHH